MHRSASYIFTGKITLPHFANSNKLPDFFVGGTWTISKLIVTYDLFNFQLHEEGSKLEMQTGIVGVLITFAMSDIESSKEGKGCKRLSGDENK